MKAKAAITAGALLLLIVSGSPEAQSLTPDWETAAGGHMAFEATSVKPNKSNEDWHSNVGFDEGDDRPPTGDLFSARKVLLHTYIAFAYKLNASQLQDLLPEMPKWDATEYLDIEARAEGHPTKDQMRLMMQSLLADRFKLAVHRETRQLPVLALAAVKSGKLGPNLRPHLDNPPCASIASGLGADNASKLEAPSDSEFPDVCEKFIGNFVSGQWRVAARNMTIPRIAGIFEIVGRLGRPAVDETGMKGTYDFILEFTPDFPGPPGFQPDTNGPTFQEALKDQLGLKLESRKGPVQVLVIDHVEEPSPN